MKSNRRRTMCQCKKHFLRSNFVITVMKTLSFWSESFQFEPQEICINLNSHINIIWTYANYTSLQKLECKCEFIETWRCQMETIIAASKKKLHVHVYLCLAQIFSAYMLHTYFLILSVQRAFTSAFVTAGALTLTWSWSCPVDCQSDYCLPCWVAIWLCGWTMRICLYACMLVRMRTALVYIRAPAQRCMCKFLACTVEM